LVWYAFDWWSRFIQGVQTESVDGDCTYEPEDDLRFWPTVAEALRWVWNVERCPYLSWRTSCPVPVEIHCRRGWAAGPTWRRVATVTAERPDLIDPQYDDVRGDPLFAGVHFPGQTCQVEMADKTALAFVAQAITGELPAPVLFDWLVDRWDGLRDLLDLDPARSEGRGKAVRP
jgi:hypothetical protein